MPPTKMSSLIVRVLDDVARRCEAASSGLTDQVDVTIEPGLQRGPMRVVSAGPLDLALPHDVDVVECRALDDGAVALTLRSRRT